MYRTIGIRHEERDDLVGVDRVPVEATEFWLQDWEMGCPVLKRV